MYKLKSKNREGIALIICMVFLAIFSALAVGMIGMADNNVQIADNQHSSNVAFAAAQSGLDCGKYLIAKASLTLPSTGDNFVSAQQLNDAWYNTVTGVNSLCEYIRANPLGGQTVPVPTSFIDSHGSGTQLLVPPINYGTALVPSTFTMRFYRYDNDANFIQLQVTGTDGEASRKVTVGMQIKKSADVLKYAIASKTRIWITGDSTIHGNIYSSWKYQNISPFDLTSTTVVEGTIGTILTNINPTTGLKGPNLYAGTTLMPYDLETLDADGNPIYDISGNKVINSTDGIRGQSQGVNYNVNYGEKATNMPGMDLADYDTATYKNQTSLPTTPSTVYNYNYSHGSPTTPKTVTEYFPHNANDYTRGPSGSLQITRNVCENKTLSNFRVASSGVGKNAVFKNCTFEGILYVDNTAGSNNVRFENCVFNGPIVTTPSTDTSSGWWQRNQLYFTGTETFQNNTTVPATILAPNFNVNLGNTNPNTGQNNVLTGAIVGGIVDVRGNAQIYGTIIAMFDTSAYPSGYVSNIGATLLDGGSETVSLGDVGTIDITPNPDQLLPSGITTPIVIVPQAASYSEEI